MKNRNLPLELFDGQPAGSKFINDLDRFLVLNVKLQKQVICNTFLWYPEEDIDKEWDTWLKGRTANEKQKIRDAVSAVLYITRQGLIKRFTVDHFSNELKKLGFKSPIIQFFVSQLMSNRENFIQEIARTEVPVISRLTNLNWRIDVKKSSAYLKRIDEPSVILGILLSGQKSDKIIFELSIEELESLMRTLGLIQSELKDIERGDSE